MTGVDVTAGAVTPSAIAGLPRRSGLNADRVRTLVAPVLFGVAALGVWQAFVIVFKVKPFVLPGPIAIGGQFTGSLDSIWSAMLVTALNAFIGLVVGTVFGIVVAVLCTTLRILDRLSAPAITAASVIPIVSLAPVLYTMFGANVQTARQLVAALAVFIPVYFNTVRGLRSTKPVHRDLLRAYAATRWQATTTVTLPGALPFLLTGIRIASSLAVISALIAEYFGGPVGGLGKSITSAVSSSNYALAWAFVLGAILTGLVFYLLTVILEKGAMRHRSSL